ncbi:MAG: hypothetical protein LBL87_02050 [Ruminococcus sp.]|jgi:hypothetical protein|nr:hypothetical protein [Ruminococcus sp.]
MKNLKSVLAIFMVLVVGVCLTGCQSAEEKAESERLVSESERAISESVSVSESVSIYEENMQLINGDFLMWFKKVTFEPDKITINYSIKGISEINDIESIILTAEDKTFSVNRYTELKMQLEDTGIWLGVQGIEISLSDYTLTPEDIDSISITFKDKNGTEITETYYQNVE